MKKQIPNLITAANLICGGIAITEIAQGHLMQASLLVLLAAFFDFFDGLAARLLGVGSELGGQLDSLADAISFGLVPAYLAFSLLTPANLPIYLAYSPFIMAAFSAYRLAKFNLDTRQSTSFIGLPTPANALLWISIPLITWQDSMQNSPISISGIRGFFEEPIALITLMALMCYLMVAEIPLLALKFKSVQFKENKFRYILIVFSLVLFALLFFAAIPFILILYLVLSLIENKTKNHEIQS